MDDLTREDFERMKQTASERVMQMHRSRNGMPPFPDFVQVPDMNNAAPVQAASPAGDNSKAAGLPPGPSAAPVPDRKPSGSRAGTLLKYINIPEMMNNSDALLLLGLILLLSADSADETLILALAYILL